MAFSYLSRQHNIFFCWNFPYVKEEEEFANGICCLCFFQGVIQDLSGTNFKVILGIINYPKLVFLSLSVTNKSVGWWHTTQVDSVNSLSVHFVPSAVMVGAGVTKLNKPMFLLERCLHLKVMTKVNPKATSENLNPQYPPLHNNLSLKPLEGI